MNVQNTVRSQEVNTYYVVIRERGEEVITRAATLLVLRALSGLTPA